MDSFWASCNLVLIMTHKELIVYFVMLSTAFLTGCGIGTMAGINTESERHNADALQEQYDLGYAAAQQDMKMQVSNAYMQYVGAQEEILNYRANIQWLEKELKDCQESKSP